MVALATEQPTLRLRQARKKPVELSGKLLPIIKTTSCVI